jgi:hypothetical protein
MKPLKRRLIQMVDRPRVPLHEWRIVKPDENGICRACI